MFAYIQRDLSHSCGERVRARATLWPLIDALGARARECIKLQLYNWLVMCV